MNKFYHGTNYVPLEDDLVVVDDELEHIYPVHPPGKDYRRPQDLEEEKWHPLPK